MPDLIPTILGLGYHLPEHIRGNDDACFAYLREHEPPGTDLFTGYVTRHVLADTENLIDIMQPAAQMALKAAAAQPSDIGLLLGCTSPGRNIVPSDLYELHKRLGLDRRTLAVPLGNDFSNFNVALVLADALIRADRARTILVAIGGCWSRAVDDHDPQAISAADGAAAAVVGIRRDAMGWHILDQEVLTDTGQFGKMYLAGEHIGGTRRTEWSEPAEEVWTGPYFHITPEGRTAFLTFGRDQAPKAALALLERQGLTGDDITLICHQASKRPSGPVE